MGVVTICLTCWLIFVAETTQEEPGQGRNNPGLVHTHFTRFGSITGRTEQVDPGRGQGSGVAEYFTSFTGIPYATPPVSNRRFAEAEPVLGWPGELDATRSKAACPRTGASSMHMMTEDCLYLNIYTKNLVKRNYERSYDYEGQPYAGNRQSSVTLPLRPVIVFITGHDFQEGAGNLGGARLMREELVVVTVEYRTGLLGFLSDETKSLPGNLGLADLGLALDWVQQAIAEFGGNPNSVTVAGWGQGAVMAHLLSLNPRTSNQFHKLIMLSGSALCRNSVALPYSYTASYDRPSPYYIYKKVLSRTRCSTKKCLQDKSLAELIRVQTELEKDNIALMSMFGPMVDNHTRVGSPLVQRHPADLRASGAAVVRPLPMLLSATRDEGLAAAAELYLKNQGAFASPELFRKQVLLPVMKSLFGYWKGSQTDLLEAIYRQYFKEVVSGDGVAVLENFGEMLSDVFVNSCMRETMMTTRELAPTSPIFAYIFSHTGGEVQSSIKRNLGQVLSVLSRNRNLPRQGQYGNNGVLGGTGVFTHSDETGPVWRGDDLMYLWSNLGSKKGPQLGGSSETMARVEDRLVSENLTNIWASFASLGYPLLNTRYAEGLIQQGPGQGQGPMQIQTQDWPMVEPRGPLLYYNISVKHPGLFQDFRKPLCVFWQYQIGFYESLAHKAWALKGYAVATYVLLVTLLLVTLLLGAVIIHYRRKSLTNEKALHTRDYNSWVANMNNMKGGDAGKNKFEIK